MILCSTLWTGYLGSENTSTHPKKFSVVMIVCWSDLQTPYCVGKKTIIETGPSSWDRARLVSWLRSCLHCCLWLVHNIIIRWRPEHRLCVLSWQDFMQKFQAGVLAPSVQLKYLFGFSSDSSPPLQSTHNPYTLALHHLKCLNLLIGKMTPST